MPQLLHFRGKDESINIAESIGDQWEMVGISLLDDESGAILDAISEQHRHEVKRINIEILRRWIRGEGISDRTWRGLFHVLRVHKLEELAKKLEEALTAEAAAEAGKSYPLLYV